MKLDGIVLLFVVGAVIFLAYRIIVNGSFYSHFKAMRYMSNHDASYAEIQLAVSNHDKLSLIAEKDIKAALFSVIEEGRVEAIEALDDNKEGWVEIKDHIEEVMQCDATVWPLLREKDQVIVTQRHDEWRKILTNIAWITSYWEVLRVTHVYYDPTR